MSKSIPQHALVVVADGQKAILFRNEGTGAEVSLRETGHVSPKNLADEGPSGSRPGDQTPKQTDQATFAKQLAEAIYKLKQTNKFEHWVLVAPPQTLGQIRDAMHKTVESALVFTLAKELTNHSSAEIAEALEK